MTAGRRLVRAALVTLGLATFGAPLTAETAQDWRAAALASFDQAWQVINDTYYDPTFGGLDWAAVHRSLRPDVLTAATADEARGVIREMLGRLGQSHFVLLAAGTDSQPAGSATIAIDTRVIDDRVVVSAVKPGSSAAEAGIRAGDALLAIDGRPVADIAASAGDLGDRASRVVLIGLVDQALHGPEGQIARLTLLDPDGQFRELAVAREDDDAAAVAIGNLPRLRVRTDARTLRTPAGREVGVIGFNAWMPVVAGPFAEAIDAHRSADGLVIDLRGNPGGLAEMIRGLSGHIVAEPVLIGRIAMRGVELEIRANPRRSTPDGRRVEPFAGPVAVLIDEMSGSASECFAGGLQSLGRVRVFGRPSMGQALPAATRALPSGDVLMYAVGDFITSTGERLEGAGVMPDEFVALSIDDLAAGRDVTLEAALGWIDDLRAASAAGG